MERDKPGVGWPAEGRRLSRVLEALRRAEAERSPSRTARTQPPLPPTPERWGRPQSALRRFRTRRRAREAARAARRAEAAARQAALVARLDRLDARVRALDETVTKQLGELEPRLLHAFELRSRGLERELQNLAASAPLPSAPALALAPARLAALALVVFALGAAFARACA